MPETKPQATEPLYREASIRVDRDELQKRDGVSGSDSRIPIALSSEQPVERFDWWTGERIIEILDHSPDSVDLSRAVDGLPFFVGHDSREMVGLIEDVRVDADRIMRGEIRFSRSERAQEIKQDMLDGIRLKISIGYTVDRDHVELTKAEGDSLTTFVFKLWTPLEGSTVPIPADPTVGVGRSQEIPVRRDAQMPTKTKPRTAEIYSRVDGESVRGEALASALTDAIDGLVTDERSKTAIVDEMAGGPDPISRETVEQILDGEINGPPMARLEHFAEVIAVSVESLVEAAERDGCSFASGKEDDAGRGKGRASETQTAVPAKEDLMPEVDQAAREAARGEVKNMRVAEDRAVAQRREADIRALCSAVGVEDRADGYVTDGLSVNGIAQILMVEAQRNMKAMTGPSVDLSSGDRRSYSIKRAIMAHVEGDWSKAGFEREVHDELMDKLPDNYKPKGGILIPTRGVPMAGPVRHTRALTAGTATAGAELVFTESGEFIDLLRNRMKVIDLGARILSGLEGPVSFPKQSGAGSVVWVAENPGSDTADSDLTTTQVALNPKTAMSSTAYARQLLVQSSPDVDGIVRDDLASVIALELDRVSINGSGASNQPTGILNATGVNVVALGTNGAVPTWANVVDLETQIAVGNADIATQAMLTTPGIRGKLKTTEKASSTARFIWEDGEVNGYRSEVSGQVPSNLSKGTGSNLHALILGVWDQLLIGNWGAFELIVDPFSKKKQALIEVTAIQIVGLAVRYPEAFSVITDAIAV